MLIDTHCHLDAPEFDADRDAVIAQAVAAGVTAIVIPAVARANFDAVRELAHALTTSQSASLAAHGEVKRGSHPTEPKAPLICGGEAPTARSGFFTQGAYALGIHPLFVPHAREEDLADLDARLTQAREDTHLVAIGEIGLDFFVPELTTPAMRARQEFFYTAQLDLALRHHLPVLLHVRRSQDVLLKHLRRRARVGGIAHAFNGSLQQAQQFIAQGFILGVGGAMTWTRALQIRRLATQLPLSALTLETDAPDIPPAWLANPARNTPAQVARIAEELAQLRGLDRANVAVACASNARRVLPRLDVLLTTSQSASLARSGFFTIHVKSLRSRPQVRV